MNAKRPRQGRVWCVCFFYWKNMTGERFTILNGTKRWLCPLTSFYDDLSIHPSIHSSITTSLPICLSVCLSLSLYIYIYIYICVCVGACVYVYVSVWLSFYDDLSIYPSILTLQPLSYLSIYLSIYLSMSVYDYTHMWVCCICVFIFV